MIYKDASQKAQTRVSDLLAQMTLEEKVAQLTSARTGSMISDVQNFVFSAELTREKVPHGCGYIGRIGGATDLLPEEMARAMNRIQKHFVEETRLGIPVLFMTEATSGVLSRNHTLFPQNIGAGSMFDEEPIRRMADAMRREMIATGERWALGPVVDVIRDHRYGRYEESFGEDAYLVSQYGTAYVQGLQSEDLTQGIIATLKHFVAQGISDGGRNCGPVHVTDRELLDEYAVPFEAAIRDAGALSIMAAYHEIDHVPVHASAHVLRHLLQERLGFEGLTVSDGNGIQLIQSFQEYCETQEEAVKLALEAGIECELDFMFEKYLRGLVEKGDVAIELVDSAVRKVLDLKFRLGLFDQPYVNEEATSSSVCTPDMVELSEEMALRTMTLLKNESNLLPLDPALKKIAVIGPLAHVKEFGYSDYSYPAHIEDMYYHSEGLTEEEVLARTLFFKKKDTRYEDLYHQDMPTVYESIAQALPNSEVVYRIGIKDTTDYEGNADFYQIEEAVAAAQDADVIIAVCGDTSGMGRQNDSGESTDRVEITLSPEQKKLLRALKETGRPVVLVLCNARPLELLEESQSMDAILEAWKPGMRGGSAIAKTLTGAYNPGGKLSVTLPKALGQLPVHYAQLATGHKQFWRGKYLEMDLAPLYPFGYGLSYTTFAAENVTFQQTDTGIIVNADIRNTGDREGDQVVQVYVRKKYASVLQPERELKAFKRVSIEAGQSASLEFNIDFDSIGYHDRDLKLVLENVQLDVMLGFSSQDIQAEKTFRLEFAGGKREIQRRVFSNSVSIR